MKVLQIIYNLSSGGGERFVVDLCNELADNNDETYLLTINANTNKRRHYLETLSQKVTYQDIGANKGLSLKSIWGVYKEIKKIKPDIVHLHCSTILIYLPALFYKKTKYVQTLHNLADKAISFQWLRMFQRFLFKNYIKPITISEYCNKSYNEYYKLDNAVCITNGRKAIKTTINFEKVKKEIEGYKQSNDIPIFVHVARYAPQKNQKLLFNTFEQLHNAGKDFLLIVIGAGYDKSPFLHLNETIYVKIVDAKKNIGDYLACADYFVLSSIYEGLPLALLEAMSMGCIPISTPAGGVVDVIKDGENGFLCTSFEELDFYNTILKALNNKTLINHFKIKKEYEQNYTMDICFKKYYQVYKELLTSK